MQYVGDLAYTLLNSILNFRMNLALLSIVISILYQPCSSLLSNYCSGYGTFGQLQYLSLSRSLSHKCFIVCSKTFRLNAVKEIHTPSELDAVTVRSNAIVVIDYQKSKCKPCMKIEPLFIALSEKYSSQVD